MRKYRVVPPSFTGFEPQEIISDSGERARHLVFGNYSWGQECKVIDLVEYLKKWRQNANRI